MSWQRRSLEGPLRLVEFLEERLLQAGFDHISCEREPGSPLARLSVFVRDQAELPDPRTLADWLEESKSLGLATEGIVWSDEALPDHDWNAGFRERFKGRRLTELVEVLPPWEERAKRAGEDAPLPGAGAPLTLVIEPAQAFGTGEHPSTRGCLQQLGSWCQRPRQASRCLDIGSGTGILAIAAKLWGAATVLGFDLDPAAITNAYLNADLNGLRGQLSFRWGEPQGLEPASFDLILCNLFLVPILRLLSRMDGALAPGGSAILAGFLEDQAPQIADAARGRGWRLHQESCREGWTVQEWEKPA